MKNILKKICFLVPVIALIASMGLCAFAQGNVSFNPGTKKFVFAPGSDESPTDLFTSFKDVMPGDSLSDKIVIKNEVSNNVKIKLYIKAIDTSKEEKSNDEFLSKLKLTVKQASDTPLYEATADQEAQLKDWVYLGTVFSGGTVTLDIKLDVPLEMGNEFQDAMGYVDWCFKAEELPVASTDPKPPQTGDDTQMIKYISIMAASAVVIVVSTTLIFKKKKVSL
ncbi:MAG: hypothetical protein IKU52_08420 [Clostridia bacterium]|nr:hypothetical protein [Clostridia bacterium]